MIREKRKALNNNRFTYLGFLEIYDKAPFSCSDIEE